jgi:hypothetical protein
MADEKAPSVGPLQANATAAWGVQLTGAAPGSHVYLLGALGGGVVLILAGTLALCFEKLVGLVPLLLGSGMIVWACLGWRASRRDIDAKSPASLTFKSNGAELALTGDGVHVHTANVQQHAMNLIERIVCQKALPPPSGVINGSAADPQSLVAFNDAEASVAAVRIEQQMQKDKDALLQELQQAGHSKVAEKVVALLPEGQQKK